MFVGYYNLFSQIKTTNETLVQENAPEIKVIARAQKDKILLRWAPTTSEAWRKLNKYGYQLERYTVTRDNKALAAPEKVILSKLTKAEPLESWETLIQENDNAAILAQALYGESFAVTGQDKIQGIINLSEENEQRFTYALFAADNDFESAKKAGLGYEDKAIHSNEKYLYRVVSNVPILELEIKYSGVFLGLKDYEELPKPLDFSAHFGDKNTILSWNFKSLAGVYGSYYVERALDKQPFERITEKPYTSMNQENTNSNTIFYVDSIANSKPYNYRVQGISPFGELGPYSKEISGKGKTVLQFVPHLTIKEFLDDNTAKLTWDFPSEGDNEISGFELNRSDDDVNYTTVIKNIAPKNRTVVVKKLAPTNYFTITAIGKQGSNRTSFAMLVQPVDSIPPAKPLGLKGVIDSTGVVKLTWLANKENDLMGYRIYRANNEKEEFSQLTVSPQETNSFMDSVVVKNLNSKVYYKLIAVDYRYNMSEFSEVLVIEKPDVIPPSSPVFKNYEVKDGQVYLEWANSSSEDAKKLLLYRKENDQNEWSLILDDEKKTENFLDKNVTEGNQYSYAVVAKDKSGLESLPSPLVHVLLPKSSVMPAVKGFFAQVNAADKRIELSWSYDQKELDGFEIFKAEEEKPLQLMLMVAPSVKRISDVTIAINTSYNYAIRALFKDGRIGKMSFFTVKF